MSTKEAKPAAPPKGVIPPTAPGGRTGFLSDVIVDLGFAEREAVEQAVRAARSPGTTVARVLVEWALNEQQGSTHSPNTRATVVPGLRAARTACSTASRSAKPRSTITSLRNLVRPPGAVGGVTPSGGGGLLPSCS